MTQYKQAISFLKEQAIVSYQCGDIGKVRHLSGIALEKSLETRQDDIAFNDILWAFIFMVFYFKSNRDFSIIIDRAYKKFGACEEQPLRKDYSSEIGFHRPTSDVSPYIPLLNFVLDVLRPNWMQLDEHYKALYAINILSLPDREEITNELLITRVIEFWWYIDNESDRWAQLAMKWKLELQEGEKQYKRIDELWNRLTIQRKLLNNLGLNEPISGIETFFVKQDDNADCLMAHAWLCVFLENWKELDNLFLKMKNSIPFESEYALSYQGLINSTKYIRKSEREANKVSAQNEIYEKRWVGYKRIQDEIHEKRKYLQKIPKEYYQEQQGEVPEDDSTDIAGVLRYQRIQLTRPVAVFHSQWKAALDEDLFEIKNKPHGGASKRANVLAISMLLGLEALRLWDLGMYQSAVKRQQEISLNIGMYHEQRGRYNGILSFLKQAIILAVRSADSKIDENGEITEAENLIEILQNDKDYISEVTESIIRTPPMHYSSALVVLEILGDAVPSVYLAKLAQWSVAMFYQYQKGRAHFNLKCFNFWENIFEYHILPVAVWDALDPVVSELFASPPYWRTSDEILQLALRKAPIEKAKKWATLMAELNIVDDYAERNRYQILFNSAVDNAALRDVADRYLNKQIEEKKTSEEVVLRKYDQKLLKSQDELPPGEEEIQLYFINKVNQKCQAIQSRHNGYGPSGNINWDFARVNWSNCPVNQLTDIVQSIEQTMYHSPKIRNNDVRDLLLVLSNMARTAPSQFSSDVVKLVYRVIENPPKAEDLFFNGGPLSGFTMTSDVEDEIKYAIVRMVTKLYQIVAEKERVFFCNWALSECFTTEALNLGFLSSLFCYICLSEDDEIKNQAVNGLQTIYARVQTGDGLAYVLGSLSVVLRERRTGRFKQKPLKVKDYPLLLGVFNKLITISYNYPKPEVREGCAMLVREIEIAGGGSNSAIKEQLKRDVRARVRVAIN